MIKNKTNISKKYVSKGEILNCFDYPDDIMILSYSDEEVVIKDTALSDEYDEDFIITINIDSFFCWVYDNIEQYYRHSDLAQYIEEFSYHGGYSEFGMDRVEHPTEYEYKLIEDKRAFANVHLMKMYIEELYDNESERQYKLIK